MRPPILTFWPISRNESVESQQKHAHRKKVLRTLLFSNDFFNPEYYGRKLMTKKTSSLDGVCINYKQMFHPIQCTASRKCQYSSKGKRA